MRTIKQQIDDLGRDPLELWNVGYAHEWDAAIATVDQVAEALEDQAIVNGWVVDGLTICEDAKIIAQWLAEERA